MNMDERIKRINELYHKSQAGPLSEEEKREQTALRKEYIESVRGSLKAQLNNIDIKEADGTITNLGDKFAEKKNTENSATAVGNSRNQKVSLRKRILESRKQMKPSEVIDKSRVICEKVTELDEYRKANTILLYYPYNNEVETFALFERALADGKTVAFPKAELVDGVPSLDFYVVSDLSMFENGYKGISEPDINNHSLIKFTDKADLCIAPGCVFDPSGRRIGYGKGFYDRFLNANPPEAVIGLAYELQIVPEIDCDKNDVTMNFVITEENVYG